MKSVLIALFCLAATATAADVCEITCSQETGNWTGETSVVVELGNSTEIIYDVNYKIFVVVNLQYKLSFAVKGKFVLVLNIETGAYLLIDTQTSYAVYGEIEISFNGSVNYTKLIFELNAAFAKYESITSSTSGSFNFNLIVVALFSEQFDLSSIFQGQTELIEHLRKSFTVWFNLIIKQIRSGAVSVGRDIWSFLIVMFRIDVQIARAIIELIRVSVEYFQEIQVKIIVQIVTRIRTGIQGLIAFSTMFRDYLISSASASIENAIEWVNDVRNKPVSINVNLGGTTYIFSVTRIQSDYVIRFSMTSSSGRTMDFRILYAQGVLFIINEETSITVALYRRSFVLVNVTSEYAFVGTSGIFGNVNGNFVGAAKLSTALKAENYRKAAKEIEKLVKNNSKGGFSFVTLYKAVASGSASSVDKIVGGGRGSVVLRFYGGFFVESSGGSVGAIVVGVLANKQCSLTPILSGIVNTIGTTTQSWGMFMQLFLKMSGSGSVSSSSSSSSIVTSKGSSSWTEVYSRAVTAASS